MAALKYGSSHKPYWMHGSMHRACHPVLASGLLYGLQFKETVEDMLLIAAAYRATDVGDVQFHDIGPLLMFAAPASAQT
jgi:hypothetical protein